MPTMDAVVDAAADTIPSKDEGVADVLVFDALPDGPAPDAVSDAMTLTTGTSGCTSDAQCDEGVCWDFSDYDPLCGGTVCSRSCGSDSECISAASSAGATTPAAATCGGDGKCNFLGTGLGAFFCA